jgi:NAD(P)-dependent dehydrogenase (short-subunit alcohol dehydrogenase family)
MKTAIVTGGNRGIGFEICRRLDDLGYRVIMGCRNAEKGRAAATAAQLSERVIVRTLDVTDEESIQQLFDFVKKEYACLDLLINNAGIGEKSTAHPAVSSLKSLVKNNLGAVYDITKKAYNSLRSAKIVAPEAAAGNVSMEHVQRIMNTNLYGAWRMISSFTPLLGKSDDARIINVSSGMGELKSLSGYYPAYSMSKASLNALTIMFASELKNSGITVNAVCPGWVKTDMGGPDAPRSVEQGADTIIWLAQHEERHTGKFFRDRSEINW